MKTLEKSQFIKAIIASYKNQRGQQKAYCEAVGENAYCWKFPSFDPQSPFDFVSMQSIITDPLTKQLATVVTQVPDRYGRIILLESCHTFQNIRSFCLIRQEEYKQFDFKVVNYTKASVKTFYLACCKAFYGTHHKRYIFDTKTQKLTGPEIHAPSKAELNDFTYFPELMSEPINGIRNLFDKLNVRGKISPQIIRALRANLEPRPDSLQDSFYFPNSKAICDEQGHVINAEANTEIMIENSGSKHPTAFNGLADLPAGSHIQTYSEGGSPSFNIAHNFFISEILGVKRYHPISLSVCTSKDYLSYKELKILKEKKRWRTKKIKKIHIVKAFSSHSGSCKDLPISPTRLKP